MGGLGLLLDWAIMTSRWVRLGHIKLLLIAIDRLQIGSVCGTTVLVHHPHTAAAGSAGRTHAPYVRFTLKLDWPTLKVASSHLSQLTCFEVCIDGPATAVSNKGRVDA